MTASTTPKPMSVLIGITDNRKDIWKMREVIITKTEQEEKEGRIVLIPNSFKQLEQFIQVAQRMRPDRIIIEYKDFTRWK